MNTDGQYMTKTAVKRTLQTAINYPGRPALELHNASYSYLDLTETAAAIARSITELNDPCPYVAVMADKSFSCFAGILGIMMAGKAYLPLNPRLPAARNIYMLEKARTRTIIAGENTDEELDNILDHYPVGMYVIFPEGRNSELSSELIRPRDPAYLLFTSGTTGKPKGVAVSNSNLSAYLDFMLKTYDFRPEDRFTQLFDLTFDLSVHDIFLAWSCGACLCVPENNSSFAMARFIREKHLTVWFSVPSVLIMMERMRLLKPEVFPSIRLSFFCGEALHARSAAAWKKAASRSRLVNLYGPTEATIAISRNELPEDIGQWKMEIGIVSIGKLFEKNVYKIEKENVGDQTGELCLAGPQVVDGYFENEEEDKNAFVTDQDTGQKWYKTGDMVKADEEGDLYFMGRKDAEVKISGYRVNLKEIENVIAGYELVGQAVVIYDQATDGQGIILAFTLINRQPGFEEKKLDAYCREQLPWYMVPGKFIFVEEFPLNLNGKVDVPALKQKYADGK